MFLGVKVVFGQCFGVSRGRRWSSRADAQPGGADRPPSTPVDSDVAVSDGERDGHGSVAGAVVVELAAANLCRPAVKVRACPPHAPPNAPDGPVHGRARRHAPGRAPRPAPPDPDIISATVCSRWWSSSSSPPSRGTAATGWTTWTAPHQAPPTKGVPVRVEVAGAMWNRLGVSCPSWRSLSGPRCAGTAGTDFPTGAVRTVRNVRHLVLARDGEDVTVDDRCRAVAGTWFSPYDGPT